MESHLDRELSPPPPLLAAHENVTVSSRCMLFSVAVAMVWISLGAGDWYMRFHWFGWQRNFIIRGGSMPAASAPAHAITNNASRGGDLSNLIGIQSVASRFEETRPAATNQIDEFGFRNVSPLLDHYDIVVVGDSYAETGPRDSDTFPAQLAGIMGKPVFNFSIAGRGTFWAIARFFATRHFSENGPKILVWPVIEREVAGGYFEGGLYQITMAALGSNSVQRSGRLDWSQFKPSVLHRALPNTSAFSMLSSRIWNRARYALFGMINPAVVESARNVLGGPMLFYTESVSSEKWSDKERNLDHLERAVTFINSMAKERGITLVLVFIPDKERIYGDTLPYHEKSGILPTVLPESTRRLSVRGVHVVNLMPSFSDAANRGELIFWRDDTHWNPAGVRLAAEVVATELKKILQPNENQ